ncbi:MAG: DMT family transporter [Anaerolineae bacterium]|nr:DMT family transporter [Anaerolineae bacterium]
MNPSISSKTSRGYIVALISAVFLSTTAIFIRYLTQTYAVPPLVLAFWRDVFVVVSLFPILLVFKPVLLKINRSNLTFLFIFGFLLAAFNALWTLSVWLNGAAIATVMCYCSSAFTAVLGWLFLKESLNPGKLLAIFFALVGIYLVSGAITQNNIPLNFAGLLTGILAGLCYALYSLLGRIASQRGIDPWTTLLYCFGFAALFLLIPNLLPGQVLPGSAARPIDIFWLQEHWTGWAVLFLLAAIPTLAGFGLYNISLVYLPSSVANLIVTLEPVFTAITAYFLLNERMNIYQVVGSASILLGVIILRLYERRISNG